MSNVNRTSNWGYLPDYSHPNHTLRTQRMSREMIRARYSKAKSDRIPPVAYLGAAGFVGVLVGMMFVGSWAGF